MSDWTSTLNELPDDGILVLTKIDDENGPRNEAELQRRGNLWFSGDMYMYYRPTHWKPLQLKKGE